ncbi:MAG: uncharacterized protein PWQ79_1282 [Thermococcaceae archaeon]|nr:uncharacterized protein [Thermococcaceae archaeon]
MSIEYFAEFIAKNVPPGKVVEIGIGFQFKVALRLKELGYDVFAVDWNPLSVEKGRELGIKTFRDDVFNPNISLYTGARAIYSIRPTPEIVKPIIELGKRLKVKTYILPLAGDVMPHGLTLTNYRGLPVYVARFG